MCALCPVYTYARIQLSSSMQPSLALRQGCTRTQQPCGSGDTSLSRCMACRFYKGRL